MQALTLPLREHRPQGELESQRTLEALHGTHARTDRFRSFGSIFGRGIRSPEQMRHDEPLM